MICEISNPSDPYTLKAIQRRLGLTPGDFWRAVNGKLFVERPEEFVQGDLFTQESEHVHETHT